MKKIDIKLMLLNKLKLEINELYKQVPNSFKSSVLRVTKMISHLQAEVEELKETRTASETDNEWITTPLDGMTLAERLRTIDSWYLETFGLNISSLGDDTSSFIMISPNHTLEEMTPFYKNISGWIVEVKKSLASPFNGEYLREQPHNCFITKVRSFAPLSPYTDGNWVYNIIICKPVATVLRSLFGTESIESRSPLIREIGKLARILNVNLHPRIDLIVDGLVREGVTEFGLFTKPFDYVPMKNYQAWKDAGKPDHGNYFIPIKNLRRALSVAGEDALFLEKINKQPQSKDGKSALTRAIGQSYTKTAMEDYDLSTYLPSTRLARYIDAVNQGEVALAKSIVDEVQVIQTDYFKNFNYPDTVADDDSIEEFKAI